MRPTITDRIIFGTYRLHGNDVIGAALRLATDNGIYRFDTAQLYRNEKTLSNEINALDDQIVRERIRVNTKLSRDDNKTESHLDKMINMFGDNLDNVFLHHPMNYATVRTVQMRLGRLAVSNYSVKDLEQLHHATKLVPAINQIEFHPFLETASLLNYCRQHGIRVQGHTVLAQGKYLDFAPLVAMSRKYGKSPAQIMIRWALQQDVDLVLSSKNEEHVKEWLDCDNFEINDLDMAEINGYYIDFPHRFYEHIKRPLMPLSGLDLPTDIDDYVKTVSEALRKDLELHAEGQEVSEMAVHLNKISRNTIIHDPVAKRIASAVFPDDKNFGKFLHALRKLRSAWHHQRHGKKRLTSAGGGSSCSLTSKKTCQLSSAFESGMSLDDNEEPSDAVKNPTPMPVEVTKPEEFNPIFDWLLSSEETDRPVSFLRGTYFPDRRLDLCKMVVGSTSIGRLCDVVSKSRKVEHFLLGNNVACETDEENGARAFASIMENNELGIKTFYLAGNEIGPVAIKIISEAMQKNHVAEALWLKRNPIGTASLHLKRMLNLNKTLVLLDLHNVGLLNPGLLQLCDGLENTTLKHLYLDANGLTRLQPLYDYLPKGRLETLYLSMNRLRSIRGLCVALKGNTYLQRLCISGCDLNDSCEFNLLDIPSLRCLDAGLYKSTKDMGANVNRFTEASVEKILEMLDRNKNIEYLSLLLTGIPYAEMMRRTQERKLTLIFLEDSRKCHSEEEIKLLRHPAMVKNIDSVYRGKM